MEKTKMPYKVMFIKGNEITKETNWIMAESEEIASRLATAKYNEIYSEEVRILVQPFC